MYKIENHKVSDAARAHTHLDDAGYQRRYQVVGQVFFTSADRFLAAFDYKEGLEKVTIDVHRARFWDITAIGALDKAVIKFRREGTEVEVIGLDQASATLVDKYAVHDKPDAVEKMMGGH